MTRANKPIQCPHCERRFADDNDLRQHAKYRHGIKPARRTRDEEESLAEIAVDAAIKYALGDSLDDLERSLLP